MSHYGPSRDLVVEVYRTLLERGYLKATEGNVSVRVPGEDAFAIYLGRSIELVFAELVNRLMRSCEMLRMLGSGTESVMAALRAVRTFTGNKWVMIRVGGV